MNKPPTKEMIDETLLALVRHQEYLILNPSGTTDYRSSVTEKRLGICRAAMEWIGNLVVEAAVEERIAPPSEEFTI